MSILNIAAAAGAHPANTAVAAAAAVVAAAAAAAAAVSSVPVSHKKISYSLMTIKNGEIYLSLFLHIRRRFLSHISRSSRNSYTTNSSSVVVAHLFGTQAFVRSLGANQAIANKHL